jgi:hypothetical protein
MWEQLRHDVFHLGADACRRSSPRGQRLVGIAPQQLVQVCVAPNNRERGHSRREGDLVGVSAEEHIRAKEGLELGRRMEAKMPDAQLQRRKSGGRDLATDADERNEPEFQVMPVQATIYVDVLKTDGRRCTQTDLQANSLIVDLAIAFAVAESIGELLGRCHHVINQPHLAEIEATRQVESKAFVFELFSREIQQPHLGAYLETPVWIVDLLD